MEKKNKLPLIIGIVLGIILIIAVVLFFVLGNRKITITFNENGGEVLAPMEVKKGALINLPDAKKEGFSFEGWYHNEQKVPNPASFEENVTLVAHYIEATAKTMIITFETDGGNKIEPMTIECDPVLNLPTPTKTGYKFVSWQDKNEIIISNETKLTCEDVTLYAKWEKVEEKPKASSAKPASSEAKKEYTCPSGYTLNGTKCTTETTAKTRCSGERTYDYNNKCVTITYAARKDGDRSCPKKNITVGSYAGQETGEMVYAGTYFCYYHKLSYNTQSQCESLTGQYGNFVWRASNNSCYVLRTTAEMTCDNLQGYAYIANPNSYSGVNGLNSGCYPIKDQEKYCDAEYTLTNGKCVKTIDATLK